MPEQLAAADSQPMKSTDFSQADPSQRAFEGSHEIPFASLPATFRAPQQGGACWELQCARKVLTQLSGPRKQLHHPVRL